MSISITAIPFLLLSGALGGASIGIGEAISMGIYEVDNSGAEKHISEENVKKLLNKDFETQFMDANALIKTLEEHGAEDIIQDKNNNISCKVGGFHFDFFKSVDAPYFMQVHYNNESGLEHIVDDINSEYRANAQEISYNKIKERLEEKNLSIDEEEIYDDNTIVLTVNLE